MHATGSAALKHSFISRGARILVEVGLDPVLAGPPLTLAIMHTEQIEKKQWIESNHFFDALAKSRRRWLWICPKRAK